ncbi:hypothetical protein V6N11_031348 [Hibiscus sabdariffa]|uniref:Uncharacterized protein n=1 Tax=Hibiscus sabdariffa TaxID=183260 RepID=A0ABR2SXC9_9ROSI
MVGRRRRKQGEKRPTYVHGSSNFTCVIHYRGDFVMSPGMKYTSKRVANFDFVDVDTFSTFTLYEIHGAATGQEEAYVNEEEAEVYEDEEIHVDTNEEDVDATATEEEKEEVDDAEEEVNVATIEEEGDATEKEEEGDTTTEEEVDVVEEEEDSKATEEFDVSDHEYDWAGDEECRQEDGIGFRVQMNMDGFGPDGVNLNEKDKESESETDNSEDLYNDHGSDSDRPSYSLDINALVSYSLDINALVSYTLDINACLL